MSDEDEDVIVLQVCANQQCLGIEDLEFDEESGEMYCANCRKLFALAEKEGFHILLSAEDEPILDMIFDCFDEGKKGFWTFKDFDNFRAHTDHSNETDINNPEALKEFFKDEYDIDINLSEKTGEYVVRREDLANMYGGYLYNNINALHADCDALEDAGMINTGVLE